MKTSRLVTLLLALLACGEPGPVRVAAVTPGDGLASGGQTLLIEGSGFGDGALVTIGGHSARVVSATDGTLEVIAPRGVAGPTLVEVSLEGRKGLLDGGFTYRAVPLSYVDVTSSRINALPVDGAGVAVADADSDGRPELFQAVRSEGVLVYPGNGGGLFGLPMRLSPTVPPAPDAGADAGEGPALDVRAVVPGDFDRDGKLDLLLCTVGRTQSQLWLGTGGSGFVPAAAGRLPALFGIEQAAVAGDVDGDSDLDLIVLGSAPTAAGAPQVMLLVNDGHGTFTDVTEGRLAGPAFDAPGVALGDLDGDGNVDLFFSGSTDVSRIYLGDGHGVFQRGAPDALPNDSKPLGGWPALGDLDGNGTLDVFMPTAGQDRVLFNDGSAHFDDVSTIFLGAESGPTAHATLVDLDLDGSLDVIALDRPGRVRLYRNDGQGRLFDYSFELAGNDAAFASAGLAVADLDGDGDDDLLVSRADLARPALFFNLSPSAPLDGDRDGWPDAVDNCPAVANRDQAELTAYPFGCRSGTACRASTGCELRAHGASAYLFCRTTPLPWAEAQARCRVLGGNLAAITGAEENGWLKVFGTGQAWVGLEDRTTEGAWVWSSGESVGFTAWGTMQPDNAQNLEDCGALVDGSFWNDDQCGVAKAYVCETLRTPDPSVGDACRKPADGGQ